MTLTRMMMRNPRIRIRSPTTIGAAICHDGMGGAEGCLELHAYAKRKQEFSHVVWATCAEVNRP